MFYIFPFPVTIYVHFLVRFAILIEATSYLLLNQALHFPLLLMSFSLMFEPHPFHLLMVFTTMLFLFTITRSISGFTRYVKNQMFIQPLSLSSNLLKIILPLPLKHFTQIVRGEFLALRSFLVTHGITNLTTSPHTPKHNGYFERWHRHIIEKGLTLLHQASIPLTL